MSARRGKVEGEDVRVCGWCSSGKHLPSETSLGCTRYGDRHPGTLAPCECPHPIHKEAA